LTILYIILALFIFGLLIFIHELGHFIVARLCGVKILEFAIGMGPTLVSWKSKKTDTKYALRLFPIGGFVNMLGENGMEAVQGDNGVNEESTDDVEPITLINDSEPGAEPEEEEPSTVPLSELDPEIAKQAYCNQSAWKRILISLAGPAMNIILGFVLMLVLVLLAGHEAMATNMIGGFYIDYVAEEAQDGFLPKDSLYSIDGERIFTHAELTDLVKKNPGKTFSVVVLRANEETSQIEQITFETTFDEKILEAFRVPFSEQNGLRIDDTIVKVNSTHVHTYNELYYEITNQGYKKLDLTILRGGEEFVLEDIAFLVENEEGVEFGYVDIIPYRERNFDFITVMKHTWFRSLSTVKMVYDSLFGMITGRFGVEAVSGPVGITKTIGEVAQIGFTSLLNLVVIISINLGVMNLLPLPALDGCHILIYLIELVRRKPMKKEVEAIINFAGLVILLTLAVIIAFKDIITLL